MATTQIISMQSRKDRLAVWTSAFRGWPCILSEACLQQLVPDFQDEHRQTGRTAYDSSTAPSGRRTVPAWPLRMPVVTHEAHGISLDKLYGL